MTELIATLNDILGEQRLKEITIQQQPTDGDNEPTANLMNAKEISCECSTIILKPDQARLIVPSNSMLETEKDLMFLQRNDKTFKELVRGCYWMVDDMYKFEQIGYTKEVDITNHRIATSQDFSSDAQKDQQQSQSSFQDSKEGGQQASNLPAINGLRYLACAECNLCPLGWYDPKTKESYLYVW